MTNRTLPAAAAAAALAAATLLPLLPAAAQQKPLATLLDELSGVSRAPRPAYRGGDAARDAAMWEIGPMIRGRNYSRGMPLAPTPARDGWSFDFSTSPAAHVHYVTFPHGSLAGKRRIVMRYRIDAARGVRFIQQEAPGAGPASLSLYFQRAGDSWNARGPFATYRWYAGTRPLAPGTYELAVPLDGRWQSVTSGTAAQLPGAFADALAGAERVGFTFGGSNGLGHGVYATGPARFTLLSFRVE